MKKILAKKVFKWPWNKARDFFSLHLLPNIENIFFAPKQKQYVPTFFFIAGYLDSSIVDSSIEENIFLEMNDLGRKRCIFLLPDRVFTNFRVSILFLRRFLTT